MADFSRAFAEIIQIEGEWANEGWDNGGLTRWGISSKAHPDVDLHSLTLDSAGDLYRREYWVPIAGDVLPWLLAFPLFDGAVNHGPSEAVRLFQKALGVAADGRIGPKTLRATALRDPREVLKNYLTYRALLYVGHEDWVKAGKGWMRRLFRVQQKALEGA